MTPGNQSTVNTTAFAPAALPRDENERLASLAGLAVLDSDSDPEIDAITVLAADRFEASIALVSLVDAHRQWFKSTVGLATRQTDRAVSFCAHAILEDEVFIVLDAHADDRFRENPLVTGQPHIRFYAGAPLVTRSGHRIGTLCVIDPRPRDAFSPRDARALQLMARQVITHLELRQLRLSDQISHLIGTTTSDAFVCADAHSTIIHWNRAAEIMFGWSAAEAIGRPLDLIVPERHRGAHHGGMARLRAGGLPKLVGKTVEVPACTRDGRELPIELSLGMWTSPETGLPAGFTSIIRDISARKALEAERDAAAHRLTEQIEAIEASNDGIAITDPDGGFVFMNDAHAAMFGFASRADPIGLPWRALYCDDEIARLEQVAFPVLAAEGRWRGRSTGTRRDGGKVEQEISLSLNSGGGIVCVTRDIGARLAAEREQMLLREQLLVAQRQEALGQIASGIAHDFNNCIAAISGSAGLIQDSGDAASRVHADRIVAATGSAASLVEKMLSLGKRNQSRKRLDLRSVVGNVAELLRASLAASQRLSVDLPATPIEGFAVGTELMQIVLNLGINARDALNGGPGRIAVSLCADVPGSAALTLAIGARPTRRSAIIRVADSGCGIRAADIPRIFQPHYSRKGNAGTGLGLSIVAGLVTAAGGGIAVASTPGHGTVFEIYWPLDLRAQPRRTAGGAPAKRSAALRGVGVLVADDDPHMVATLSAVLEAAGAEVGPVQRPRDALAAIREDPDAWSLLVTDYDMPGMTGAELAEAARRLRPGLPVLLCTALPHAARSHAGLFAAILPKPVSNDRLLAAAAAALAKETT